jgi:pyridoxamine 5'-phosphate oxidase
MRRDYPVRLSGGLAEPDLAPTWLDQFRRWFADAVTATRSSSRTRWVSPPRTPRPAEHAHGSLKDVDECGFVFFTNYTSRKATELAANPAASLLFPWHAIGRQVVVTGRADGWTGTAPRRTSRPGRACPSWAPGPARSPQVIGGREDLDRALADAQARFPGDVPAPPHWGGYQVVPDMVEFWHGRPNRLHDRIRFVRDGEAWRVERLGP